MGHKQSKIVVPNNYSPACVPLEDERLEELTQAYRPPLAMTRPGSSNRRYQQEAIVHSDPSSAASNRSSNGGNNPSLPSIIPHRDRRGSFECVRVSNASGSNLAAFGTSPPGGDSLNTSLMNNVNSSRPHGRSRFSMEVSYNSQQMIRAIDRRMSIEKKATSGSGSP